MWTNETIFSEGDLSSQIETYYSFIETEYSGSFADRLDHVENMIDRLTAEKSFLKKGKENV